MNPRPSDYKSDALPTELRQRRFRARFLAVARPIARSLTFAPHGLVNILPSERLKVYLNLRLAPTGDPWKYDGEAEARAGVFDRVGQVGEWLKPTDCKSVRPCGVRRFESFPVHQKIL